MTRHSVIVVGLLVVFGVVATVATSQGQGCTGDNISWAGQNRLAVIDLNGGGPGAGDCFYGGRFTQDVNGGGAGTPGLTTGTICVQSNDAGVVPFCNDTIAEGDVILSPLGGFANVMDFGNAQFGMVDLLADGSSGVNGGAGNRSDPVLISHGTIREVTGGRSLGSAAVCNDGSGTGILVTQESGVNVLLRTEIKRDANNQDWRCVLIPTFYDICFAIRPDGSADIGIGPITSVLIPAVLPNCGSLAAPAASAWGLIGLAIGLLAAGTWLLGRRRIFSQSLPTP